MAAFEQAADDAGASAESQQAMRQAHILILQGKIDEAIALLRKYLKAGELQALELWIKKAEAFMNSSKFKQAIEEAKALISIGSIDEALAILKEKLAGLDLGPYQDLVKKLQAFWDSNRLEIIMKKVQALLNDGDLEQAIKILKEKLNQNELAKLRAWFEKVEAYLNSKELLALIQNYIDKLAGAGLLGGTQLLQDGRR